MADDRSGGALFLNRKKTSDRHPDMRGDITVSKELVRLLVDKVKAGEEPKLAISGWQRSSEKAGKYISLALDKPFEKSDAGWSKPSGGSTRRNDDDDLPF